MFELASLLLLLQNMLLEIEEKVLSLAERSLHSQSLLQTEGGGGGGGGGGGEGGHTSKEEAERLAGKLVTLKDSLEELQGMLLERQGSIQVRRRSRGEGGGGGGGGEERRRSRRRRRRRGGEEEEEERCRGGEK